MKETGIKKHIVNLYSLYHFFKKTNFTCVMPLKDNYFETHRLLADTNEQAEEISGE